MMVFISLYRTREIHLHGYISTIDNASECREKVITLIALLTKLLLRDYKCSNSFLQQRLTGSFVTSKQGLRHIPL